MWVIQGDVLFSVPDGAPVPPGATRIEPPPGFLDDPRNFTLREGKLVETPPRARKTAEQRNEAETLTVEEIAAIRAAIRAGKL